MTSIFDDPEGRYLALVNDEGQYSVWPAVLDVPSGWRVAHAEATREAILEYIEHQWTDMRPLSLIRAMSDDV